MKQDDLEIENGLNLIAKSSIFVFVAVIFSKLFTYLYRIIIARYYGPEVYGLFSLALMIFGLFIAVTSLGLFDGLIRYISIYRGQNEKDKIKYIISFSSKILFSTSVIAGILLYLSSNFIAINIFHDFNLIVFLRIFAFLIPIQIFTNIYFTIIRSHEKIRVYSFGINILENILKLISLIVFIYIGIIASYAVSISYLFAIFSGLVFAYFYCRIKLSYIFLQKQISKKDKSIIQKKLFIYSTPLIFSGIIGSLMFYFDTFLIGYFNNSYYVGIYNSAIPIATLLLLSSDIFLQMFFPLITREISSKKHIVVKELSKQVTKWIFMVNLPLTILILLFPGVFINLFFGEAYISATNSLRLLALGQFIYSMGIVSNNMLMSYGKSKILLSNIIVISILNFILNWILIPIYGITGAAFATFISFALLSIIAIVENYLYSKIFPFRRKMITIFLISLIPAIILYKLSQIININILWLISLGVSFVCVYLLLILLTKSFDKNDWGIIKGVFRK